MIQWLRLLTALAEDRFYSQHPQSSSQPPVIKVPGYPAASSDLSRYQASTWNTDICTVKASIHIKSK